MRFLVLLALVVVVRGKKYYTISDTLKVQLTFCSSLNKESQSLATKVK